MHRHLEASGFVLGDEGMALPALDKVIIRRIYAEQVRLLQEEVSQHWGPREPQAVARLAPVRPRPDDVQPRLVPVVRSTPEARLWRWVSAHWSVPVSQGYGRRMRFLVVDDGCHGSVIGIIGLADPVFSMAARDAWLGWDREERKTGLSGLMEAFALGAVPPYDSMLGGKLIAMLCASSEIQAHFFERYHGRTSRIAGREHDGFLRAITTQSAFGRSSIYNRLRKRDGSMIWKSLGYTAGSGDGHFHGEIYRKLLHLDSRLRERTEPNRSRGWKRSGPRNKKEVLFNTLPALGIDPRMAREHGIRREVFIAPLSNRIGPEATSAGREESTAQTMADLTAWWADRWGRRAALIRPPSSREDWRLVKTPDPAELFPPQDGDSRRQGEV